jgi:cytochrome c-type biogenesis protein CcmE
MKRKHRRGLFVLTGMVLLAAAAALVLIAFEDNIVFFYSPSDLATKKLPEGQRIRIGGRVVEDSVERLDDGVGVTFRVTDFAETVPVVFRGVLPDLFREGQDVVAEGVLDNKGVFMADTVLAKHDERYMPPEVAEALREAGQWRGEDAQ